MTTVMKLRKIKRRTLVRLNPGSGEPDVAEVGSARVLHQMRPAQ
jgi:hypothetical protein